MKALILGSGGREYTLGLKLSQNTKISELFFLPGNGGTLNLGQNVAIDILDFQKILSFINDKKIDLVVVGSEMPLVNGIVDFLNEELSEKIKIIGPSQKGANLEGSKAFAKEFMLKHNIPTANYKSFSNNEYNDAINFLKTLKPPYVIKADGLAAGKGVLILDNIEQAASELKQIFSGKFGNAGNSVVIEEFLNGIELSVFAVTDGENYKILPTSKDYKKAGNNDTGLNTGGMGAVSPVPFANDNLMQKIEQKIIKPTFDGLKNDGITYKGFLYFGLMNVNNDPYVIEYNVRLGDPETQAVLPRIESDFANLMIAIADNKIKDYELKINPQTAVSVVLASGGYPETYEKNKKITFNNVSKDVLVIHAGTKFEDNELLTNGGRVLTITAFGNNINEARSVAYKTVDAISFDKKYFRNDIGLDLL